MPWDRGSVWALLRGAPGRSCATTTAPGARGSAVTVIISLMLISVKALHINLRKGKKI